MTLLERLATVLFSREDLLERVFARRRCFVCLKFGWCEHREPEVELADLAKQLAKRA